MQVIILSSADISLCVSAYMCCIMWPVDDALYAAGAEGLALLHLRWCGQFRQHCRCTEWTTVSTTAVDKVWRNIWGWSHTWL